MLTVQQALVYSQMQLVMTECRLLCAIGPPTQHADLKSYQFKTTRKDTFTEDKKAEAHAHRGGVRSSEKGGLTAESDVAALVQQMAAPRLAVKAEEREAYLADAKKRAKVRRKHRRSITSIVANVKKQK